MTYVKRREEETFDSLLRRFRRQVIKDRTLSTLKRKRFFVSKSELRRRARRKAVSRERKRQWKEQRQHRS